MNNQEIEEWSKHTLGQRHRSDRIDLLHPHYICSVFSVSISVLHNVPEAESVSSLCLFCLKRSALQSHWQPLHNLNTATRIMCKLTGTGLPVSLEGRWTFLCVGELVTGWRLHYRLDAQSCISPVRLLHPPWLPPLLAPFQRQGGCLVSTGLIMSLLWPALTSICLRFFLFLLGGQEEERHHHAGTTTTNQSSAALLYIVTNLQ